MMTTIDTQPDDMIKSIFEFIGPGEYRFIGGVNQRFRKCYKEHNSNDTAATTTTNMKSVTESISRCRMYLQETTTDEEKATQEPSSSTVVTTTPNRQKLNQVAQYSAFYGRQQVLQFALQNGASIDVDVCARAAQGGNLEILQWALTHEKGCMWDAVISAAAAKGGQLEILKWIQQQDCDGI